MPPRLIGGASEQHDELRMDQPAECSTRAEDGQRPEWESKHGIVVNTNE